KSVMDNLERYGDASGISALQGSGLRRGRQPEFLQTNWAPGPRLLACLAGGGLAAYGVRRGGAIGGLLETAGAGLIARAIGNQGMGQMFGLNGQNEIAVNKTINIDALPEEVFRFWSNFENFPRFMRHVR